MLSKSNPEMKNELEKRKSHQERCGRYPKQVSLAPFSHPAAVPRTKARTGNLLSRHGSGTLLRIIDRPKLIEPFDQSPGRLTGVGTLIHPYDHTSPVSPL